MKPLVFKLTRPNDTRGVILLGLKKVEGKVRPMFSISGIQLREISDAASYLAPISEVDRAYKYPYDAPEGGFVLASGRLLSLEQAQLDQMDEDPNGGVLAGRTPFYQLVQTAPQYNCFVNLGQTRFCQ